MRYILLIMRRAMSAVRSVSRRLYWEWSDDAVVECGMDECGYGSLAGPVVTAAVIWPKEIDKHVLFPGSLLDIAYAIRDSKTISPRTRERLADFICDHAIDWTISARPAEEVDQTNVLIVRDNCFYDCLEKLAVRPGRLLIDGDKWDYREECADMEVHTIPKGDDNYLSIACASIIGKVWRDRYMTELHEQFPMYHWNKNKGYGAQIHIDAMREHGLTEYHRKSWRICRDILLDNYNRENNDSDDESI